MSGKGKRLVTFCRTVLLATLVCQPFLCSATTCIALKKFKIRQVCGQIQTVMGDQVPDAMIQVVKNGDSSASSRMQSDPEGYFRFGRLDEGEYTIRVEVGGFHPASQEFEVRRPMKEMQSCSHPLLVLMQVAGCSSVAKVRTKDLKKINAQTH